MGTPMNPMEAPGNSSFTFAVTFAAEGDGVRAAGELTEFAAQGNEPMAGPASICRRKAKVSRSYEGSMDVGGAGPMSMRTTAATRVRLAM